MADDLLWRNLKDLPAFRGLLRAVEAYSHCCGLSHDGRCNHVNYRPNGEDHHHDQLNFGG